MEGDTSRRLISLSSSSSSSFVPIELCLYNSIVLMARGLGCLVHFALGRSEVHKCQVKCRASSAGEGEQSMRRVSVTVPSDSLQDHDHHNKCYVYQVPEYRNANTRLSVFVAASSLPHCYARC